MTHRALRALGHGAVGVELPGAHHLPLRIGPLPHQFFGVQQVIQPFRVALFAEALPPVKVQHGAAGGGLSQNPVAVGIVQRVSGGALAYHLYGDAGPVAVIGEACGQGEQCRLGQPPGSIVGEGAHRVALGGFGQQLAARRPGVSIHPAVAARLDGQAIGRVVGVRRDGGAAQGRGLRQGRAVAGGVVLILFSLENQTPWKVRRFKMYLPHTTIQRLVGLPRRSGTKS